MHRSTKDISNSWSEEYNIPLYTQVPQEQIDKLVSIIALREMEIEDYKTECNRLYRIIELNGKLVQEAQGK